MKKLNTLRVLEWGLLVPGLACLLVYGASRVHSRVVQGRAEEAFAAALDEPADELPTADLPKSPAGGDAPTVACPSQLPPIVAIADEAGWRAEMQGVGTPDRSTWDPARREGHSRALAKIDRATALARLDIPKLGVSVMVLPGCDALCLNGGVGHIAGTPAPGEPGNVGIAGHRDGFFRPLEKIAVGDTLRLRTQRGTFDYRVQWTKVVDPTDVSVLSGCEGDALTLVTCYPFRVVGNAPKRFIVRAQCAGASPSPAAGGGITGAP